MGWSKDETDLFHPLLEELILKKETASLNKEKTYLDELRSNSAYFTQKNIRCTIASFFCTACAFGITSGIDMAEDAQILEPSQKTYQTFESIRNVSALVTRTGALAITLFGGTTLFDAGTSWATKKKQHANITKHRTIQTTFKENGVTRQHIIQQLRQRTKA